MPQSDPWLDSFVQNFQRLQQQPQPEGVFSRYVKPAVMAPLHVLGSGYRAIGNVATGIEGLVEDGDPLSKFRLSPEGQQQGVLGDIGGAFGIGGAPLEAHDPFQSLANVGVHAIGGQRASDVDPQWEEAFRRANPGTTFSEAAGDLAGSFATQALLDPVLHGLGAAGARAGAGVLAEGAARPTYNVLPEMVQKAFPTVSRAFEGGVPDALLAQTPERAGQIAHGLGAAFVPGMLVSGAERLAEAPKAIGEAREQGAPLGGLVSPQAVETLGQGAVDTAFGLMGGMHAFARRRGIEAAADTLGEKPPAADAGLESAPPPPDLAPAPPAPPSTPPFRVPERPAPVIPEQEFPWDDLPAGTPTRIPGVPLPGERAPLTPGPGIPEDWVREFERAAPPSPAPPVTAAPAPAPDLRSPDIANAVGAPTMGEPATEAPAPPPPPAAESVPPGSLFAASPRTPEQINAEMETLLRGKRTRAVEKRLLELRDEREAATRAPAEPAPERPDLLSALSEVKPLAPGGTGQAPLVAIPRLWEHVREQYGGDRAAFDRDLLDLRQRGEIEAQKGDTGLSEADLAASTPDPAGGRLYAVARRAPAPAERQTAAPAPATPAADFPTLRSRLQSLMGSAIRRVEEVPSGSPDRAGRAGVDIEWRNGMRTRILETGEIIPDIRDVERGRPEVDPRSQVIRAAYTPERAAARAAGGEGRGTLGEGQGIPAGAVIRLAEGKWSLTDANAELLHDAWARLLRGSERKLLTDRYARELEGRLRAAGKEVTPEALEEEAVHKWAEEVTKWQERAIAEGAVPKASPGWFKRLWEWVTRMASALRAPEFERLTREAAEGGLWQRGASERAAGALGDTYREGGIAGVARAGVRFASDRLYGQQNKLGLYSQLDKALEKAPTTASGQDWARFLLGKGVKKEELRWTGVDDLLQQKGKERVSKREIEEWVREHDVGVEEVTRGDLGPARQVEHWEDLSAPELERFVRWNDPSAEITGGMGRDELQAMVRSMWEGENDRTITDDWNQKASDLKTSTKFAQYQLPGGSGYREVLLTLPPARDTGEWTPKQTGDVWEITNREGQRHPRYGGTFLSAADAETALERAPAERARATGFTGPHWSEPNVLAHLRLNDRTDADGKRVLFVEEVQSDWAQKGRREGFNREARVWQDNGDWFVQGDGEPIKARDEREARLFARQFKTNVGAPAAPYVTSTEDWSALAMKRVLRMAAEEGYDRVAWTPGEVQAARYDLSKHVGEIEWQKNPDGTVAVNVYGPNGAGAIDVPNAGRLSPKELEETIGKELTEKIVKSPDESGSLQGLDLKVGGEGMHGYYDKILPGVVSKLGKKFGAKVGSTEIQLGRSFGENERAVYEGPTPTVEQIDALLATDRRDSPNVRDVFDNPVTGRREMFAINRAATIHGLRELRRAIVGGEDPREAMHQSNAEVAGLLGGELKIVQDRMSARMPSIDITPEMRKSVMEEGFARFAASPRGEAAPEGSRFAAGPRDIPPFTEADKAVADAEAAREKARAAARELRTPPIRAAEREAARAGREVKKAEKVRTEAALREHIGEAARKPGEGPEIIGLSGDKHEDGTPMEAGDLTRGGPGIEPRMMTAEEAAKLKPTQVARKVAEYEEGKAQGFAIKDLARDVPDTLAKAGPRVRTLLETKPDSFFVDEAIKARKMGHVLGGDLRTALNVVVEGRKVAMQNAVRALDAAREAGPGSEEAVAKEKYKFFVSTLEHMHAAAARAFYEGREAAVNDATEAGRTLQAAARVVAGTKSINDAMIDAIMKETRGKVDPRALAHLKEVLADPKGKGEFLDEALRGIFKPTLLDKIIEGWKAGLVSAPGTLLGANPLGNAGELLARMAESRTAPAVDAMAHRLGLVKERTRFMGEAEMESHGMRQAYAGAGVQFGREAGQFKDLAEGLRDTWKGIEPPPKAGQKYESQVRAIGRGPEWMVKALDPVHRALFGTRFDLGARIRLPLSILQVTDDFFYRLATGAELGKLSYREARAQLGAKASEREIIARAKELHAEASDKGGPLYRKALELAKSRVFHPSDLSDPSHVARTAKHVRAQFKLSHFVIPFVDTPLAIARLAIERSPLGFFKAAKRWTEMEKAVKAGKPPAEIAKLRDEALDLSTRASLGTALTVAFTMLAQSGILTGKGPTDPKKRAVLLDSGWQPYSVAIPVGGGKTAYIPYNRFEPLSSLLGVFADLHETPKGEKNVIKTMGIALSNITSKTFLSGLSEFFGALDKPEEALPGYAANLAGSFVPNVVAKGAQAIDPVVRETKPPEGGITGRIAATIESRIPGVSETLPARYGPTGLVSTRPGNAVSRFLSPVQISTTSPERAVEAELARISYAPPTPDREVRVGSQKVPITVAEQERLVGEYERATERVSRLLKSPAYRAAPDDGPQGKQTKRTMIRAIYQQAERKWRDRHAGVLLGRARAAEAGA